MIIDELYYLIRSEKVVLWAGAGLSLYAGYPSAHKLSKAILKNLKPTDRKLFNGNMALPDVCEQFLNMSHGNQNLLIKTLRREFGKRPKTIYYHQLLSTIPHFRTIATTNYDTLFEQAFGNDLQVFCRPTDLCDVNVHRRQLFKVHGDLNHLEELVISKSDYARFYNNRIDNALLTVIKERIINNHVLFVGYGFSDINIESIIAWVSSQLGSNSKCHYLVAPDLAEYHIERLRKSNIQYIDMRGEGFIENLLNNLKKNIVADQRNGLIGLDTMNAFLRNHQIAVDLKAVELSHRIVGVKSLDNSPKQGILSLKFREGDRSDFANFLQGRTFGSFDVSDSLAQFDMSISGISLVGLDEIKALMFVSVPITETIFDILFENGFEIRGLPAKVYASPHKSLVEVTYRGKVIKISMEGNNTDSLMIDCYYDKPYGNPSDELEAFRLLESFFDGLSFTVFLKNGKHYRGGIVPDQSQVQVIKNYVSYFLKLIDIERYYNVRFDKVDQVSEHDFNIVSLLLKCIAQEEIFYEINSPLEAVIDDPSARQNLLTINDESNGDVTVEGPFELELYGRRIQFTKRIWKLYDPELINVDEVIAGSNVVRIRSKSSKASDTYIF